MAKKKLVLSVGVTTIVCCLINTLYWLDNKDTLDWNELHLQSSIETYLKNIGVLDSNGAYPSDVIFTKRIQNCINQHN